MRLVVVLAWVLGAGSLACFGAFLWTGGFEIFDLRLGLRWLLAFDAALCLMFFAQHSILIRRSVRNSLGRVIPEYCYGVFYTFSSSIALLLLILLWQRSPVELYALHDWTQWMFRAVLLLAFVCVFWGIRSLERFDAFGINVLLAHLRKERVPPAKLTITGPYRLLRHPFYACAIVAVWATPVLTLDRLLFNVLVTVWIILGAGLEERDLLAEFGEGYAGYRRAVPMLMPRLTISRRRKADKPEATSTGHSR